MNKLYLDFSDVIHANRHTIYANCGLHVNFCNFWFMPFMMKNMLLWPQVPFSFEFLKITALMTSEPINDFHKH